MRLIFENPSNAKKQDVISTDLAALGVEFIITPELQKQIEEEKNKRVLWEENRWSLEVFLALLTQVRVGGMSGIVGLDYNVIPIVMKYLNVPKKQRKIVFKDILLCEKIALEYWNKGDRK